LLHAQEWAKKILVRRGETSYTEEASKSESPQRNYAHAFRMGTYMASLIRGFWVHLFLAHMTSPSVTLGSPRSRLSESGTARTCQILR